MNNNQYKYIFDVLKKVTISLRIKRCVSQFLALFNVSVVGLSVFFVLDYFLLFTSNIRYCACISFFCFLMISFLYIVYTFFVDLNNRYKVTSIIENKYKLSDNITNLVQIITNRKNLSYNSNAFLERAYKQIIKKVKKQFIVKDFTIQNFFLRFRIFLLLVLGICLLVYFLPKKVHLQMLRFAYPYSYAQRMKFINMLTGDVFVLSGEKVEVKLYTDLVKFKPYIKYSIDNAKQRKFEMLKNKDNIYSFIFENVQKDIVYHASVAAFRSKNYKIKVTNVPMLGNFKMRFVYPKYTGIRASEQFESNGEIEVLRGAVVHISAKANKELESGYVIFDTGRKIKLNIKKDSIYVAFKLVNEKSYKIVIEDIYGFKNEPIDRTIILLDDAPPLINILKPSYNMQVADDAIISIYYEAYDDFGIKDVYLNYSINNKPQKIKILQDVNMGGITQIYHLDLLNLKLKIGDIVTFYLTAVDNDINVKDKKGMSNKITIKIKDVLKEHDIIENQLFDFYKHLEQLVNKEVSLEQSLTKMAKNISTSTWQSDQKILKDKMMEKIGNLNEFNKIAKQLDNTMKKMIEDPMIEYDVYNEYKNLLNDMKYLSNMMQQVNEEFANSKDALTHDFYKESLNSTKNLQAMTNSHMKRLKELSKNLYKKQLNSDIRHLEKEVSSFKERAKKTNEKGSLSDIEGEKLFKHIENINKAMNNISKKLSKFKKIARESSSSASGKSIDQQRIDESLDRMYDSLESGDINKALRYAESLERELASIEKMLSERDKESTSSNDAKDKVNSFMQDIKRIIKNEENIFTEINDINEKRIKILLKKQKNSFKKITDIVMNKEKKMYKDLKNLKEKYQDTEDKFYINRLTTVINEFTIARHRSKSIKEIKSNIDSIRLDLDVIKDSFNKPVTGLLDFTISLDEKAKQTEEKQNNLRIDSKKLYDSIKNSIFDIEEDIERVSLVTQKELGDVAIKKCKEQSIEQTKVKDDLDGIYKEVKKYSEKSSYVDIKILDEMHKASLRMGDAKKYLHDVEVYASLKNIQLALDHLYNIMNRMKKMSEQLEELTKNQQSIYYSKQQQPRKSFLQRSMPLRANMGYVKIPGADYYKVPEEYRQEILQSGKEESPRIYINLIKEYYNRLSE